MTTFNKEPIEVVIKQIFDMVEEENKKIEVQIREGKIDGQVIGPTEKADFIYEGLMEDFRKERKMKEAKRRRNGRKFGCW